MRIYNTYFNTIRSSVVEVTISLCCKCENYFLYIWNFYAIYFQIIVIFSVHIYFSYKMLATI